MSDQGQASNNANINPQSYFSQVPPPQSTPQPTDDKAKEEAEVMFSGDLSDFDLWLKHENFRLRKKNVDAERDMRVQNAKKAFYFSAIWATFIGFIILMHAMNKFFVLTETEFLAVIGTLTISILTYYLLVIKYLFYRKDNDKPAE